MEFINVEEYKVPYWVIDEGPFEGRYIRLNKRVWIESSLRGWHRARLETIKELEKHFQTKRSDK